MISKVYDDDAAVAAARESFRAVPLPFTILPTMLRPEIAELLRKAVTPRLLPYDFAPSGRYQVDETLAPPDLIRRLRTLAERVSGEPLTVGHLRWTRHTRGDYSLLWDDARRTPRRRFVEATLDLSAGSLAEAETIYTDGAATRLAAPQWHGSLTLIERSPTLLRYERYLTHRAGPAEIFRLRLTLLPSVTP